MNVESNYTKEQETIRMALTNYVGALYSNSKFTGDVAKSNVNAIIIEELTRLARDEEEHLSLVALKPIFNACAWILRVKKKEVEDDATTDFLKEMIKPSIEEMNNLIDAIEKYAEKIK